MIAECRITFSVAHRAVPAPEGCGSIYTTHDTDQGIQRSKTHFPASSLDLTGKGVIFTAMGISRPLFPFASANRGLPRDHQEHGHWLLVR